MVPHIPSIIAQHIQLFLAVFDALPDGGNGLAFNIIGGHYEDELEWFSQIYFCFANFVTHDSHFDISFKQFVQARKWGCDVYGQFHYGDGSETEISRSVVYNLILEAFDNGDEKDSIVNFIQESKRQLLRYFNKTKEEERAQLTDVSSD